MEALDWELSIRDRVVLTPPALEPSFHSSLSSGHGIVCQADHVDERRIICLHFYSSEKMLVRAAEATAGQWQSGEARDEAEPSLIPSMPVT